MKKHYVLYMCDTHKNKSCPKTNCFYEKGKEIGDHGCYCTTHEECAQLDEYGMPLVTCEGSYDNGE